MKKAQQHTPEEIKKYNAAFIKFMKPDEKPTDTKLETSAIADKPEAPEND